MMNDKRLISDIQAQFTELVDSISELNGMASDINDDEINTNISEMFYSLKIYVKMINNDLQNIDTDCIEDEEETSVDSIIRGFTLQVAANENKLLSDFIDRHFKCVHGDLSLIHMKSFMYENTLYKCVVCDVCKEKQFIVGYND